MKKTSLDNNYHVAISRLKSLEVSLEKKSLRKKYDEAIQVMLEKNYAEIIPNQDMYNGQNGRIWYLPHPPVPKKIIPLGLYLTVPASSGDTR